MEDFVVGRIVDLGGPDHLFTVLSVVDIENDANKYLVVVPVAGNAEDPEIHNDRPAVVKVLNETQELEFVNDIEEIKKVLNNA